MLDLWSAAYRGVISPILNFGENFGEQDLAGMVAFYLNSPAGSSSLPFPTYATKTFLLDLLAKDAIVATANASEATRACTPCRSNA